MYHSLAKFYPKKLKEKYREVMACANINVNPEQFMGFVLFASLCIALAFSLVIARLISISIIILFVFFFMLVQFLSYILLVFNADAKGKFVEDILPDVLQLISSNLRAGMTVDKALMFSVRPEFGPFSDEINIVGKEITMGKDISEALEEMSERIKSEKLKKTISLITSGLKSGGELASLLSQTAQNLRNERLIEERVRANVLMYVIFIFSAIGFGAPLLFGLSSFLVETLTASLGKINIPEETAAEFPLMLSKVTISPEFVLTYVIVSLVTTSILGAIVIGLIRKGREREGIKYIPLLLFVSLAVFFTVRFVVSNLMGSTFF